MGKRRSAIRLGRFLPSGLGSIRLRLTVMYSTLLFGLAAVVVGGIYAALSNELDGSPVTRTVVVEGVVPSEDGLLVIRGEQEQFDVLAALEREINQRALDQLEDYTFAALAMLFVASLAVGWIVAGRVLAPIDRITAVARNIGATDLTRRIGMDGPHDELRNLADTFDDMLGRLDSAFEDQRRFIHEASHELRNPLAVIRTNLEVVLADPGATADELRQTAEVVENSAERMYRLVDDLLLYARRESSAVVHTEVDAAEVLAIEVDEFRAPAEARNITLRLVTPPDLTVIGDSHALRQAVANLLANACRLAPEGSEITVTGGREGHWVWMAVTDEGPGIAAEDQDQVFQRFWRGEQVEAHRSKRSGLGLTIVRQIVEGHGGRIQLSSAEGAGSTFSIWLPEPAARPITGPVPAVAGHHIAQPT